VLTVIPYDSDDGAVAIANNSIYGLSGEVTGVDTLRGHFVSPDESEQVT
jgi:acyl-CoA reductase-like NAD-dependent aldehyde dehydrogenase